jgi:Amt family ammonium transporter
MLLLIGGILCGPALAAGKTPPPPAPSASGADKAASPIDALKAEMQAKLDEQAKTLAELRDTLDKLSMEARANGQSVDDLKAKLEKSSIQIYEHLSRGMEGAEKLEKLAAQLKDIEAKTAFIRGKPKPNIPASGVEPSAGAQALATGEKKEPKGAKQPETSEKAGQAPDAALPPLAPDKKPESSPPFPPPSESSGTPAVAAAPAQARAENPAHFAASDAKDQAGSTVPLGAVFALLLLCAGPLGFTLLEMGRLEAWAATPAGLRNLLLWAVLVLAYFAVGHGLMFGPPELGWLASMLEDTQAEGNMDETFRLYYLALAGTCGLMAAAILSDRLSLRAYVWIAIVLGAALYPAVGAWTWSGQWLADNPGWLEAKGFKDFAGSAVLYLATAGFALAWAWIYPETRLFERQGDNPSAPRVYGFLGIFALWLGSLSLVAGHPGVAEQHRALLMLNATLAGAGAVLAGFLHNLGPGRKPGDPDLPGKLMAAALSGLAAIAAAADALAPPEALLLGILAGWLHIPAYRMLAKRALPQDEIAASLIAALGAGGAWGLLGVALFSPEGVLTAPDFGRIGIQALGAGAIFAFSTLLGLLCAYSYHGASSLWAMFKGDATQGR